MNEWVGMLRPVGRSLVDPLADVSAGLNDRGARRLATSILADYASADAEQLVDLIVNADPEQFTVFLPAVTSAPRGRDPFAIGQLRRPEPECPQASRIGPLRKVWRTRSPATGLPRRWPCLRLGMPDAVWPLLAFSSDPRVQSETIYSLVHLGAAPEMLAERFLCEPDVSVRMALLLALADCVLQARE